MTNKDFCRQVIEKSIQAFGKISILVNSAGILKTGGIETLKMEEFDESMDINVKSVMNLTQLCLPYLIAEKGAIVNVSSVTGTRSFPGVLSYCMSKAALDQFTKCVALGNMNQSIK